MRVRGEVFVFLAIAAVCLSPPVNGPVSAGYSPSGQYAGHWGIDYQADVDDPVMAPASGVVTFAGSVAGMRSVTIQPVPGFKVSVSYLSSVAVTAGQKVGRGEVVGAAGSAHDSGGVHLSTRINGRYVDPATQLGCFSTDITRALRLVTPPQPYPRTRANRNPGRDLRSNSHRPSPRRGNGTPPAGVGSGRVHAGRNTLAEDGSSRHGWGGASRDGPSRHRRSGGLRGRRS